MSDPHPGRLTLALLMMSLAVSSGGPASAGTCGWKPEGASGPTVLCETTTISGSRPGSVDVSIPVDVTLDTPFGSSPDLDVVGDGRFAGFVLTPLDIGASAAPPTMIGGRFPEGGSAEEFILPASPYWAVGGGSWEIIKFYPDQIVLPAGIYRLSLVADGGPIAVTVRFDELEGSVELTAGSPADARLFFPPPRLLGGAGVTNNVYGAGRSDTMSDTGLLFHALWLDTEAHAAGQYEFCYRPPAGTDVDPIELGPACGAAADFEVVNNRSPTMAPDAKLYMAGLDDVPPGRQHLGFWSATEAVVSDLRYVQFWLSYGTPAGGGSATT